MLTQIQLVAVRAASAAAAETPAWQAGTVAVLLPAVAYVPPILTDEKRYR